MKILHTSDWHIGKTLYGRKRYHEFQRFTEWLKDIIESHQIGALVIAGDVFDTSTPSPQSLTTYFEFLKALVRTHCRHIIITGGNHDSPAILNGPREILSLLNIHIVGCTSQSLSDDVFCLRDSAGCPELIVCASPYLREKDMRIAQAGESQADKELKLFEGVTEHYRQLADLVKSLRSKYGDNLPAIVTGHLFVTGAQTKPNDGMRPLYVGTLGQVPSEIFSDEFDYVALGHIHSPQLVRGKTIIRYSGSPLHMSFGETNSQKSVSIIEFSGQRTPMIYLEPIPVFQQLTTIEGGWNEIEENLKKHSELRTSIWAEIIYTGEELLPDLIERLEALTSGTNIEILKVRQLRQLNSEKISISENESLDELSEIEIFERCLTSNKITDVEKDELRMCYAEILKSIQMQENESSLGEMK